MIKKYIQKFEDNLNIIKPPKVSKCMGKPYTKVSWLPDYERFGIKSLTDDMFNLFKKRTYDIGIVTDKSVKVKFNGKLVHNKNFELISNNHKLKIDELNKFLFKKNIQSITDDHIKSVDEKVSLKEKEIMTI